MPRSLVTVATAAALLLLAACADRAPAKTPARQRPPASSAPASSAPAARGSGVVPWIDVPAPPYKPPPPPPPPRHDAPPCAAGDLHATVGQPGYAMGVSSVTITLVNGGPRTCVLLGHPGLAGVTRIGRVVGLNPRYDTELDPAPAANMRPGRRSVLLLGGWDDCAGALAGRHRRFPQLRLDLPAGGALDVPSHGLDLECGSWVSRFGAPPTGDTAPPVTVSMQIPPTLVGGRLLAYTITLHNRSATPYSLRPCPSYEEYFYASASVQRTYRLNCSTEHAIAPHASVTYAMRLRLPPVARAQRVEKFGWMLGAPQGVAAATGGQQVVP